MIPGGFGIFGAVAMIFLLWMGLMYLYALLFGPAMRYLGRKWEEGRQDAIDRRTWREGKMHLAEYERTKPPGERLTKQQANAVEQGATVVREPQPQYTITGRKLR